MKNKINRFTKAVAAMLSAIFPTTYNFANAFPPKKDGGAPTDGAPAKPAAPAAGATEDAGKGAAIDPGTAGTFDFQQMLLQLLGLPADADPEAIQNAFNSCMATEPGADAQQVKGKLDEATAGKNASDASSAQHAAEAHAAVAKLAEAQGATQKAQGQAQQLQKANELLTKRAEAAEAAFANERNDHIKAICNAQVITGKLTRAQADAKVVELANAKTPAEFEAGVKSMVNMRQKFSVTQISAELGRTIAPGTASQEYLATVNEAMEKDPKHDYTWHYTNVGKTEKGKALIASMQQPEANPAFANAKK